MSVQTVLGILGDDSNSVTAVVLCLAQIPACCRQPRLSKVAVRLHV